MKKLKLLKTASLFIFFLIFSFSCESPYLVKHPVSAGDVYYLYATYYADQYEGKGTANGEIFSNDKLTCAAKGFPFGTLLEVQSLSTKKRIEVVVTDRPGKNVVDLTKKAFGEIDSLEKGKIRVRIKVLALKSDDNSGKTAPQEVENGDRESDAESFFTIQLASFENLELAKKFQQNQSVETYIFTSDGKFRVRFGRYSTEEEAQKDRASKFSGSDAIIIQVEE